MGAAACGRKSVVGLGGKGQHGRRKALWFVGGYSGDGDDPLLQTFQVLRPWPGSGISKRDLKAPNGEMLRGWFIARGSAYPQPTQTYRNVGED